MLRPSTVIARRTGLPVLVLLCAAATAHGATSDNGSLAVGERQGHRWSGRLPGKPAYVWLWYADGKPIPDFSEYCDFTPPAYECKFGSRLGLDDCKAQVQEYLDAWYKDFNLVFTLTRPPSGDYYTVVITSGWPQCALEAADRTGGIAANEGGIAPGNCNDTPLQTAIAIECGKNAHDCATIIAHEHGHLVGLIHAMSLTDVMNPSVRTTAAGFNDETLVAVQDLSNTCSVDKQNSYQVMLSALGPWPGGTKPSPSASLPDAGADAVTPDAGADAVTPDAGADESTTDGSVGNPPATMVDAGEITVLTGFDALPRPPLPTTDALGTGTSPPGGGCDLVGHPPRTPGAAAIALLVLALGAAFTRNRGRSPRRHPARPAAAPLPCAVPARLPFASRPRDR
jgi:hypothetical protein